MDEHVTFGEHREDVDAVVVRRGEASLGDRRPRLVLQVRAIQLEQGPQPVEAERADAARHRLLGHVELTDEQLADLVGRVGLDLEADRLAEPAPTQLHLDRREQVVGLLLLEGQVGVAGDAEGDRLQDVHAGEQVVEVGGDDLLERDEALAVGHDDEPGQHRRHLHPREPPVAGHRVPEHDGQVQRQVGDVGEGVAGIDRERREHREDAVLELLDEVLVVVVVELAPAGEHDADLGERRHDLLEEHLLEPDREPGDPGEDLVELLARGATVRRDARHAGDQLVHEPGHPHLEELVEVLAEDGAELRPLQERQGLVRRRARSLGR